MILIRLIEEDTRAAATDSLQLCRIRYKHRCRPCVAAALDYLQHRQLQGAARSQLGPEAAYTVYSGSLIDGRR